MKFIHTLVNATVATFVVYGASVIAGENQSVLTGYFEGGAVPGRFVYKDNPDGTGLLIDYYSPSLKKTLPYRVAKYDECSAMAMYEISNTRQVVIDGSCSSQGGQIYRYVYEWSSSHKNWCLIREITGEKPDISSGTVVSYEQVSRVKNCALLGAPGPYSYESVVETSLEIAGELKHFRSSERENRTLRKFLDTLPSYSVSELVTYISPENVREINDLAFHLSENGRSYDAIPLLEKIVNSFPGRVVAKLNLADAYWDNDYKEQGSSLYKQYYNEMVSGNLRSKIPGRVFGRMKK